MRLDLGGGSPIYTHFMSSTGLQDPLVGLCTDRPSGMTPGPDIVGPAFWDDPGTGLLVSGATRVRAAFLRGSVCCGGSVTEVSTKLGEGQMRGIPWLVYVPTGLLG